MTRWVEDVVLEVYTVEYIVTQSSCTPVFPTSAVVSLQSSSLFFSLSLVHLSLNSKIYWNSTTNGARARQVIQNRSPSRNDRRGSQKFEEAGRQTGHTHTLLANKSCPRCPITRMATDERERVQGINGQLTLWSSPNQFIKERERLAFK